MSIREDLVASAAQFLQDPSVASSPIENRIAFLQSKNLTQEEVSAALARAGPESGPAPAAAYAQPPASSAVAQAPQFYAQHPPQYPPYAWQPPPHEAPRRDWRDWFIMATVVSGVGYGLYAMGKRYVYPLIAPPTPERLAEDKKSIDEQFEKTFALVEQLAKDTEALKAAETERTGKLDNALAELESVITELKAANRRREDEAQHVREEVKALKATVPQAMDNQKELTDRRMRELNAELKSLKTLITQRMAPAAASSSMPNPYLRPSSGNSTPAPAPEFSTTPAPGGENADVNGKQAADEGAAKPEHAFGLGSRSPFSSGMPGTKASIPAWQMAMATKNAGSSSPAPTNGAGVGSSSSGGGQQDAAAGSS